MATSTGVTPTHDEVEVSFARPSGSRTLKNGLATVYVGLATLLALIPLVWVLWTVISKGYKLLLTSSWWLESQRGITPRREGGGAYHAIVGTLEIGLICAVVAVPLGEALVGPLAHAVGTSTTLIGCAVVIVVATVVAASTRSVRRVTTEVALPV